MIRMVTVGFLWASRSRRHYIMVGCRVRTTTWLTIKATQMIQITADYCSQDATQYPVKHITSHYSCSEVASLARCQVQSQDTTHHLHGTSWMCPRIRQGSIEPGPTTWGPCPWTTNSPIAIPPTTESLFQVNSPVILERLTKQRSCNEFHGVKPLLKTHVLHELNVIYVRYDL